MYIYICIHIHMIMFFHHIYITCVCVYMYVHTHICMVYKYGVLTILESLGSSNTILILSPFLSAPRTVNVTRPATRCIICMSVYMYVCMYVFPTWFLFLSARCVFVHSHTHEHHRAVFSGSHRCATRACAYACTYKYTSAEHGTAVYISRHSQVRLERV